VRLRRAFSPAFPAGGMVLFIRWRVVAEESGAAKFGFGGAMLARPARAAWAAQRLLAARCRRLQDGRLLNWQPRATHHALRIQSNDFRSIAIAITYVPGVLCIGRPQCLRMTARHWQALARNDAAVLGVEHGRGTAFTSAITMSITPRPNDCARTRKKIFLARSSCP
jgi:hypothetical protein